MDGQDALMSLRDKTITKILLRMSFVFFLFQIMVSHAGIPAGTAEDIMAIRPHAVGSPAWLMEHNDCWRFGNHNYPNHVIARTEAGDWKIYGQNVVDNTLSGHSDMHVYAYCS